MKIRMMAAALALVAGSARAEPVGDWMEAAFTHLREANRASTPGGQPNRSPATMAAPGRVAAAMFEAANAADRRYRPYFGIAPASGPASPEAAVSVAAHGVLVAVFPDKKAPLDEALAFNLSRIADGPAKLEGERIGREAAKAALARVVFDPAGPFPPYVPPTTSGLYDSTTDPGPPPWAFGYKPWLLPSLKTVQPAPPPPLTSDAYTRSYEETKRVGAKDSTARTPAQTATARFWIEAEDPEQTLRAVFGRPGRRLVDNARLNALVRMTQIDAVMVIDTSKLEILRWRPVTAIRLGEKDGNPATQGDPNWEPLLRTPMSPEYPCGHCTGASTFAALMEAELGERTADARFASSAMPGAGIAGMRWADYARQASESRILGGVHFRYSAEAGEKLGRDIARTARANFAPPLGRK
ncbi:vanadium-dependent haloperoxidase [Sphingomonas lenta]|uniref:PA-phosphatase n=1 Tax=Sphingomonas lenta TaxID=1141887 RepID=A0A2A2SG32_9SPHN|nr:vanadium-dependent haloperoxidase [Sphingomonas lenta]PAX08163.1 hypothetical protein CKY28_11335 [Sphingomonas lenta]